MLHQIITVLVSNSVKFAGSKCQIKLTTVRKDDGRLEIVESDDGPGISDEALPHVFERFYRADEAHTRSAGGSGLGLAIAKTLSGALGAEIIAGCAKPHGACFEIDFPCS
jgi:signal transduction histidine kinase